MKPTKFIVKMKRKSVATYGNQRPIAFAGSPCSAICVCAISYSASPIVCRLPGRSASRLRIVKIPTKIVSAALMAR